MALREFYRCGRVVPKVRYGTSSRSGLVHRIERVSAHLRDDRIHYLGHWLCGNGGDVLLATPGDLDMCRVCTAAGYPVIYRCFDASGGLLYIGCTDNLELRERGHRGSTPWWPQVAETRLEYFLTSAEAFGAERKAIRAEGPRWNRANNPLRTGSAA